MVYSFFTIHLPWIAWMAAITVQSSFRGVPLPDLGIHFTDKIAHFIVFGILGLLITRGMRHVRKRIIHNHPALTAVILGCIFALTDEIHQAFVPARSAEVLDWVADFVGILIFSYLYSLWSNRRHKRLTAK